MAEAVAEGAREVEGAVVDIKRVPELVPDELAKASGYKLDQAAPIAKGDGSRMPSQIDLDGARFQGKHIAEIAKKQFG